VETSYRSKENRGRKVSRQGERGEGETLGRKRRGRSFRKKEEREKL
jgi:hypothetical protein